jgi:hypothetical protein
MIGASASYLVFFYIHIHIQCSFNKKSKAIPITGLQNVEDPTLSSLLTDDSEVVSLMC